MDTIKMERLLPALATAALLAGCGAPEDPFKGDRAEEYRYLRGLSNPTPEQYIRKKELEKDPNVMSHARGADAFDRLKIMQENARGN
jgi:hypothetical protein